MSHRIVDAKTAKNLCHLIGGKASTLARLQEAGAPVPSWFCISAETLADVRGGRLLAEDERAVCARFNALIGNDGLAAVRSSAVGEDSARDSFAGQFATYLGVTRDTLIDRVVRCFQAASAGRVANYQTARGHDAQPMAMGVIVQRMIDSQVAGVLFTANPVTHDRTEAVVTAGFGLGEGIVEDRVETDTFHVDLASGRVRRQIVRPKTSKITFDRSRGAGTIAVDMSAEKAAALTNGQLQQLVEWGRRIEQFFGVPQDIEWAIDQAGQLYILQARPITTLQREQIFDNSNIVESYPGLSSPLTFSFARCAYEETFRASSRDFGVPEPIIAANRNVYRNLIALIDGRIYYNILHWYQLFLMVPGFEKVLPAWERALGLPSRLVQPARSSSSWVRLRVLCNVVLQFLTLSRRTRRFLDDFHRIRGDFRQRDLQACDAHRLMELLDDLTGRLFHRYAVSVVNDFFTQQFYDRLGKLLAAYHVEESDKVHNDLFRGLSGVDSVEPVRSLLEVTDQIRSDPELKELFASGAGDDEIWARLSREPKWQKTWQSIQLHLDRFGDRTLQELKLETPTVEDRPEVLVPMLRNYLATGQDMRTIEQRNQAIRERAEAAVSRQLRTRPVRRWLISFVLRHSRRGICHRENLRLARTRAFGMFKRIFRAVGARLVEHGLIDQVDDIFYLEVEDIAGQLYGHATTRDLRRLIELRNQEYKEFAERKLPPRIHSHGPVYSQNFNLDEQRPLAAASILQGLGCSAGRVKGKAKVVLVPEPTLEIRDEILIAPATDPGWVFLMVAAKGLVVEKGSPLSHTAIIGRELGIPTVVGVTDATRLIRDGQEIEMDGRSGQVWIERP